MPSKLMIDPDVLEMHDEAARDSFRSRKGMQRFKIRAKEEHYLRFIPVSVGTTGAWYVPIAKHWVNNKPFICPTETSSKLGGDKNAECPICDALHDLGDLRNYSKKVQDARANLQWHVWVCVYESINDHGQSTVFTAKEFATPMIWEMYDATFQILHAHYTRYKERTGHKLSILNWEKGATILATHGGPGKGVQLSIDEKNVDAFDSFEKSDPGELEASIYKYCESHDPTSFIKILSTDELEVQADKIREIAREPAEGGRSRGRGRDRDDSDAPSSRRSRNESEETPSPRRSRRSNIDDDDSDAPSSRKSRRDDDDNDDVPGMESRRKDDDSDAPSSRSRRSNEEPPSRSRRGGNGEASLDDDENIPEETRDPAPSRGRRSSGDDLPDVDSDGAKSEEKPSQSRLSQRLRQRASQNNKD